MGIAQRQETSTIDRLRTGTDKCFRRAGTGRPAFARRLSASRMVRDTLSIRTVRVPTELSRREISALVRPSNQCIAHMTFILPVSGNLRLMANFLYLSAIEYTF